MISYEQQTKQLTAILPFQLEALAWSQLPGHLSYASPPATYSSPTSVPSWSQFSGLQGYLKNQVWTFIWAAKKHFLHLLKLGSALCSKSPLVP